MQTSFISFAAQSENAVGSQNAQTSTSTSAGDGAKGDTGKPGGASQYSGLIMIVVLIAVFYFLLIRPQQKKQKEMRKFREALKEGDHVVTAGGIYGKITGVKDTMFIINIGDGVNIKIDKGSVYPSAADTQAAQAK